LPAADLSRYVSSIYNSTGELKMSTEKIEKIAEILGNKLTNCEFTNKTEHTLTFTFENDKKIILDFEQKYFQSIKFKDIPDMLIKRNLVNEILKYDSVRLIITETEITPYKGNRAL
jgi:hypothetical protein